MPEKCAAQQGTDFISKQQARHILPEEHEEVSEVRRIFIHRVEDNSQSEDGHAGKSSRRNRMLFLIRHSLMLTILHVFLSATIGRACFNL
jgi:hypothetical protein